MTKNLEQLIPHRRTMALLSRIIEATDTTAVSEVDINEQSLFYADKGVPAFVGVEYLAQTVALYGSHRQDGEPKRGFLLGVRKFRNEITHFPNGATLRVHISPVAQDGGVGTYAGKILIDDRIVAEASLTILVKGEI